MTPTNSANRTERACEVMIVGGGPTGLFLATLLADLGVDVLVLERRAAPSAHSRAIGLHPPAVAALHEVGVADAAVAAGARIRGGSARSRGRELGRLSFERAWPRRPFVLSLPQSRTEELLEERLIELAPAALRRGWEVTELRATLHGVEVTAQPDLGADPDAGPLMVRARVVVGADGARSRVRDLLGVGTTGAQYPDTYLMGDFAAPDAAGADRDAVIHLEPGGVVESFPLPGGGNRWVAHTGPAPPSAASLDDLAEIVRTRTGVRLEAASATMISAFTVRRRTARALVTGRCVLIGDAAHEISPIGGQGITLGWLDALDLAPLLQQAAENRQHGSLRSHPAWQRFERACRSRARIARLLAHANMALGRPLPVPLAVARDVAVRVALGTPARRVMAWAYSMGWAR
ncbi:NAD(P)/FAD-dependent oxidoreductase [Brachybacterium sp. FME24]|uniref:FAD-dependent oxidoreductase n=1 Tax=Brachybacterium sp. FME24 TaxID=2742605 RepID=UPI00186722B0|nr:NAD(P)/FAD-dependent oxidoreductase [Brachybacterium sp. FME24]